VFWLIFYVRARLDPVAHRLGSNVAYDTSSGWASAALFAWWHRPMLVRHSRVSPRRAIWLLGVWGFRVAPRTLCRMPWRAVLGFREEDDEPVDGDTEAPTDEGPDGTPGAAMRRARTGGTGLRSGRRACPIGEHPAGYRVRDRSRSGRRW